MHKNSLVYINKNMYLFLQGFQSTETIHEVALSRSAQAKRSTADVQRTAEVYKVCSDSKLFREDHQQYLGLCWWCEGWSC